MRLLFMKQMTLSYSLRADMPICMVTVRWTMRKLNWPLLWLQWTWIAVRCMPVVFPTRLAWKKVLLSLRMARLRMSQKSCVITSSRRRGSLIISLLSRGKDTLPVRSRRKVLMMNFICVTDDILRVIITNILTSIWNFPWRKCVLRKMWFSVLPSWWWRMCRCLSLFLSDFFRLTAVIRQDSLCLHTVMKWIVVSIYVMVDIILLSVIVWIWKCWVRFLQRAHGDFPRSPIIIKGTDIVVISMPVIW